MGLVYVVEYLEKSCYPNIPIKTQKRASEINQKLFLSQREK